jgi:multidrug efflux pump
VIKTLVEALVIVTVVIFLFLGSPRAVIVPVVAMPLSLVGTFFLMLALGYSINLLTLLALVLAIGLVVDDAIIVVENVDRHLKEGMAPFPAALQAARELGGPIVAMTIVLIAAYVPIGFQGGITGALFTQFAFTLAGAVTISGVIALTLSPMMCSRMFRAEQGEGGFAHQLDVNFNRLRNWYKRADQLAPDLAGVGCPGCHDVWGHRVPCHEFHLGARPRGRPGCVLAQTIGPPNATIDEMEVYQNQVFEAMHSLPEYDATFPDLRFPVGQPGLRRRVVQALE